MQAENYDWTPVDSLAQLVALRVSALERASARSSEQLKAMVSDSASSVRRIATFAKPEDPGFANDAASRFHQFVTEATLVLTRERAAVVIGS